MSSTEIKGINPVLRSGLCIAANSLRQCDLSIDACGQCLRAGAKCTGYRDTQQLRVRNESQEVERRALSKRLPRRIQLEPQSLPLALDVQARETFFAYYVTGTSKTWNFLLPYYNRMDTPEHLKLTIEAVSLAHFSHQAHSEVASVTANEKYISALHMTNKALQSLEVASKDTTLLTSLLLDLFEKITNNEPRHVKSWTSHVNGALALVRLRGLDQFQDPAMVRVLVRLSTNLLISCVASESPVPKELTELRSYAEKYLNIGDPKWQLSGLMIQYANLQSAIRSDHLTDDECISRCLDLDAKFEALARDIPPSWQYKSERVEGDFEMIYDDRFDIYPERHITQTWNVLRLTRIFINETIMHCALAAAPKFDWPLMLNTKARMATLTSDICASVPQYLVCFGDDSGGAIPWAEAWWNHSHSPNHQHSPSKSLDCYTLIYPLYVAAWSSDTSNATRSWITKKLHHMNDHFGIRNAKVVADILEKGDYLNPWAVYAILGSYAFAA